jgi:hypothetical protein
MHNAHITYALGTICFRFYIYFLLLFIILKFILLIIYFPIAQVAHRRSRLCLVSRPSSSGAASGGRQHTLTMLPCSLGFDIWQVREWEEGGGGGGYFVNLYLNKKY